MIVQQSLRRFRFGPTCLPACGLVPRMLKPDRSLHGLHRWLQAIGVISMLALGIFAPTAQAAGCPSVPPQFSSGQGAFGASECTAQADDAQEGGAVQFLRRGAAGDTLGTYAIRQEVLEAVTSDSLLEGLRFWGDHVMTVDLPQERGGVLIIANWTGQQFAISEYPYQTGDEDSMELNWQDGVFIVRTEPEGKRRLLATDDSTPGTYAQESLACSKGGGQATQSLRLAIDMSGRITGVSYLGTTPAPDGTAYVCSVDVARGDGQAEWGQKKNALLITFNQDDADTTDGPSDPDRLRITRKDDVYTLDLDLFTPRYCGQSAQMARQIRLKKGDSTCASVKVDPS